MTNIWDYSNEIKFCKEVFRLKDSEITRSLIKYLKTDETVFRHLISAQPDLLCEFGYNNQEIRNFWAAKIRRYEDPLHIFASMLRNNLIPEDEILEASLVIAELIKPSRNVMDHLILAANGFGDAIYDVLFVQNNSTKNYLYWKFMNENKILFTQYVEYYPLKDDVVKILAYELNKYQWYPQWLAQSLNEMLENNKAKRNELREKLDYLQLDIPAHLQFLL